MTLYDEIKTPLTNEVIIKILYAFDKSDKALSMSEEDWGDKLREKLISNENVDVNIYRREMIKYVEKDAIGTLYNNIKKLFLYRSDFFSKYDEEIEEIVKNKIINIKQNKNGLDESEVVDLINKTKKDIYDNCYLYGISKWKNIILNNDFEKIYNEGNFDKSYEQMFSRLRKAFIFNERTMGFHVNPQILRQYNERKKDEIKFYVNAGVDTYKFASIFKQKCEENKLYYYFKVVGKEEDEFGRSDKMCIYSTYEDANKYIEILKSIKHQHPDIKFMEPPILSGKIDGFIGIGIDHFGNGRGSYNRKMCIIISSAIRRVYKEWIDKYNNYSEEPFIEFAKNHPEKIELLKNEIRKEAINNGLDGDKICITKDTKSVLEKSQNKREENIKEFVYKFVDSYKILENNKQYDDRLINEETDIEIVSKYIDENIKKNIDNIYFMDIHPSQNQNGIIDFSDDNINKMFRVLNAVNNISKNENQYLKDFCMSSEISDLLEKMQQSKKVNDMIKRAEIAKKNGDIGRANMRGLTPAEASKKL